MIKKFNEYCLNEDFDPNEHIKKADDIDYLEELIYIDEDLKRMENPQNFALQAKLRGKTTEEYVKILRKNTLISKDLAEKRLKKLKGEI